MLGPRFFWRPTVILAFTLSESIYVPRRAAPRRRGGTLAAPRHVHVRMALPRTSSVGGLDAENDHVRAHTTDMADTLVGHITWITHLTIPRTQVAMSSTDRGGSDRPLRFGVLSRGF